MQVKEALGKTVELLKDTSNTSMLDARLLLGSALSLSPEQLLLNYNTELTKEDEYQFFKLVERRQIQEPMAYIVGVKEFYGQEFLVNKDVLIPRPDTELLIDVMIKSTLGKDSVEILELGTGSGAICVSLALEIITAQIVATDISQAALDVARQNAKKHNVLDQISFIQSDWYTDIGNKKYDYIVSNPPYIASNEQDKMAVETSLYEPHLALYAADNGLSEYRTIIESAKKYLNPMGKLIVEIGYRQNEVIMNLMQQNNFQNIKTYQDLAGHDRVITADCV